MYFCPVAASPKKVTTKTATAERQEPDRGGEGEEEYSDEDVHSDDEFNFVEDTQTLDGMRISSVGTGTSTGPFTFRFEGFDEPSKSPTSIASSVQSGDFVGKTNFRVDDFARMLSEFKGFGSSPPASNIPEPPRIPLVVNDPRGEGEGTSGESQETGAGSAPAVNGEASESASETGDVRVRVKSVGEYVKLNESRAAAQGLTLSKNNPDEPIPEAESKPETLSDTGNKLTVGDADVPSYVEVIDDSQASMESLEAAKTPEAEKPPETIYDSPRQDDSYSVFERSQIQAGKIAGSLATPKVENLKPRLPFPVLLVSAGEGYADLRRKRPSENDKEPKIMIWQIT